MIIQEEAMQIIETALHDAKPDEAVKRALADLPEVSGKIVLVSFGKAAWSMSAAAEHVLGDKISDQTCTDYERCTKESHTHYEHYDRDKD